MIRTGLLIVLLLLGANCFAVKDSLFLKINNKLNITLGYGYTWSKHGDEKYLNTGGHNGFISGTYHTANFTVNMLYINWRISKHTPFIQGNYEASLIWRRLYAIDFMMGWNPKYKIVEGKLAFGPSYGEIIVNGYLESVNSWEWVIGSNGPLPIKSAGFTTQFDIKFNICRWFFVGGTINYRYFAKIPHLFSYGLTTGFQYTGKKKQEPKKKL